MFAVPKVAALGVRNSPVPSGERACRAGMTSSASATAVPDGTQQEELVSRDGSEAQSCLIEHEESSGHQESVRAMRELRIRRSCRCGG